MAIRQTTTTVPATAGSFHKRIATQLLSCLLLSLVVPIYPTTVVADEIPTASITDVYRTTLEQHRQSKQAVAKIEAELHGARAEFDRASKEEITSLLALNAATEAVVAATNPQDRYKSKRAVREAEASVAKLVRQIRELRAAMLTHESTLSAETERLSGLQKRLDEINAYIKTYFQDDKN